jgi:HlyD family secretion protein
LGQQVRPGDLIAVLDTYARRQAALREAQSQVQVAQAQLIQVQAGAKVGQIRAQAQVLARQRVELATKTQAQVAAIARLAAELKNAELENQRYQALYREGAVTASLRDSKQLTVDTARRKCLVSAKKIDTWSDRGRGMMVDGCTVSRLIYFFEPGSINNFIFQTD